MNKRRGLRGLKVVTSSANFYFRTRRWCPESITSAAPNESRWLFSTNRSWSTKFRTNGSTEFGSFATSLSGLRISNFSDCRPWSFEAGDWRFRFCLLFFKFGILMFNLLFASPLNKIRSSDMRKRHKCWVQDSQLGSNLTCVLYHSEAQGNLEDCLAQFSNIVHCLNFLSHRSNTAKAKFLTFLYRKEIIGSWNRFYSLVRVQKKINVTGSGSVFSFF